MHAATTPARFEIATHPALAAIISTTGILATGPDEPTSSHANKAPIDEDFRLATCQDTFATVPIHDGLSRYQQQQQLFSGNSTLASAVDITEDFGKPPILIRQHHINVAMVSFLSDRPNMDTFLLISKSSY